MKKTTIRLIVRTLTEKIQYYERAIAYTKSRTTGNPAEHIENLEKKVSELRKAIQEVEKKPEA